MFLCEIWESFRNAYFEGHLRTIAPVKEDYARSVYFASYK